MPMNNRLMRPMASGFNPRRLASLGAWYDASDSASVTQSSGVSSWADKSGNARNLLQNSVNSRPAYNSLTLNGLPVITFDGSNDFLQTASTTLNAPHTLLLVARFENAYTSGTQQLTDGVNGSTLYIARSAASAVTFGTNVGNNANLSSWTTWAVYAMAVNTGAGNANFYQNGSMIANGSGGSNGTAGGITLGRYGSAGIQYANASFAEFIHYSRILGASELSTVTRYLGRKWAITVV